MDCPVIRQIFYNSQFNDIAHEKLFKKMKVEYEKKTLSQFFGNFIRRLGNLFVIGETHATVERSLNFAAKFCVSLFDEASDGEEMPLLLQKLFQFLFESHQTRNQAARFRICQFINKLLSNLGDDASLDEDICTKIGTNMLERLQDKIPAVRAQAIMALQRLQDPANPDCPVIKAYIFHLTADPSPSVRRAVLNYIGRSNVTLPHILERTRDVSDKVRRDAYQVLTKLNIRSLTIKQRERLLREGLKDRSELVSNFVATSLLPSWLRNMKGNYIDLLHALDVENSTKTSILAVNTLLKHRPLKEVMENLVLQTPDKIIPQDSLTTENALYWRCLTQHLHSKGGDLEEHLDSILPELTPFCQYIRSYYLAGGTENRQTDNSVFWSQIQRQFIVHQLLEITKVHDLADEMGRSSLKKLIYDMLISPLVKEDLIPILVELLETVDPNVNSRLQFLAEIVSEVHEPMTEVSVELPPDEIRKKEIMQAKLRVELNEISEEQESAVREKDFEKAQTLLGKLKVLQEDLEKLNAEPNVVHEEVRGECNDRATLSKCLSIIFEMMQAPTVTNLTPHLRSLMENFVMRYIEADDTYVRSLALKTIGLFCLLDLDLAKQYMIMFFFQLANNESDQVCSMALKIIFDLFHLYGLQPFEMEENNSDEKETDKSGKKKLFDATELEDTDEECDSTSENTPSTTINGGTNNFISILTSLLDSTSVDMRTAAAEGLCKLLLSSRIKSSNLVSRLLIMWYNPVTEGDIYLRQMLGEFFPLFASNCLWAQESLEEAFLPTIRTLFQAPVTSPLVEVDQDSVIRLLLNLTQSGVNQTAEQNNRVHNNLAIALCNEVLVEMDIYNIQVLLRGLTQLELILDDSVTIQNIKTLAQKVAETVKDKTCLRFIRKFQQMLSNSEESALPDGTTNTFETPNTTTTTKECTVILTDVASDIQRTPDHQIEEEEEDKEVIGADDDNDDDSDGCVKAKTPHPLIRGKTVIPQTPDSPLSLKSSDTCSSDMVQVDGEAKIRSPKTVPRLRRSGRQKKRRSQC